MGGGGALELWASSDFVGKSWESSGRIPSSPQNSGSHLQGILGKSGILTASFEGAPIMTREEAGSQSRDSAACED